MTQEQFEALGIEKSLAKKAAEASKKELEGYVSKDTYDQTEQQRKQLETSANDYKTQLEDLKKAQRRLKISRLRTRKRTRIIRKRSRI